MYGMAVVGVSKKSYTLYHMHSFLVRKKKHFVVWKLSTESECVHGVK